VDSPMWEKPLADMVNSPFFTFFLQQLDVANLMLSVVSA